MTIHNNLTLHLHDASSDEVSELCDLIHDSFADDIVLLDVQGKVLRVQTSGRDVRAILDDDDIDDYLSLFEDTVVLTS